MTKRPLAALVLALSAGCALARTVPIALLGTCQLNKPQVAFVADGATPTDCSTGLGAPPYEVECACLNGSWRVSSNIPHVLAADLPVCINGGPQFYYATDGATGHDCSTGGGSIEVPCSCEDGVWAALGSDSADNIHDADADTYVRTEQSADEDKVRIGTGGTERVVIDSNGLTIGGGGLLVGASGGAPDIGIVSTDGLSYVSVYSDFPRIDSCESDGSDEVCTSVGINEFFVGLEQSDQYFHVNYPDASTHVFSVDAAGNATLWNRGDLRLAETTANGTNYFAFEAPASFASNRLCTLQDAAAPIPDSCVGDGVDGGGGNSFETINAPSGTDPVADSATDTLNLTSSDSSVTITGTAASDTVDMVVVDSAVDHGSLGGLSDDDHAQYALLAGRSASQTLDGHTGASGSLTLNQNDQADATAILMNDTAVYIRPQGPAVTTNQIQFSATGGSVLFGAKATINSSTGIGEFDGAVSIGTVGGNATPLVFEGATADAFEATWSQVDPTADRTYNAPNADATLIQPLDGGTEEFLNSITDATGAPVYVNPETVNDLQDFQGAVTDGQVPNAITVDLATTATTATLGDSATAFFSAGAIEAASGGTGAAPTGDDYIPVADSATAITFRQLPDSDATTQKLQYDQATNTFSAGTDLTGGTLVYANTSVPAGNTVASTASETAFSSSYTIPAADFVVGQAYRVVLKGVFSTDTVAPTVRGKVKWGSTLMLDTGTISSLVGLTSNLAWSAEGVFVVQTTGASGAVEAQGHAVFATAAAASIVVGAKNTAALTIDTTTTQAITVTVQWGTSAAANTITLREMAVERLVAPQGGGTMIVEEVDGSPSYGATGTVRFDQADGFVVTQPGAGISRVDLTYVPTLTGDVTTSAGVATTLAAQPYVNVYRSTTQSLTSGVITAILFDSETEDTSGYHSTSSNTDRITVAKAGIYSIDCVVSFATGTSTTTIYETLIDVNAAAVYYDRNRYFHAASGASFASSHATIRLAANDYVQCLANQTITAPLNVSANSGTTPTQFRVTWEGY